MVFGPMKAWLVVSWVLVTSNFPQHTDALTTLYDPDEDKSVQLFEEEDQKGENSTTIYWHDAAIKQQWTSIQQSGVWIYYSEENYRGDNVTVVFGEDVAINLFHPLKSVRYAGNSQSSTLPAVILYRDTWFRGQEYYIELTDEDELMMVPNFRDMGTDAKSIIIIGAKWRFFTEQNFQGPNCWYLQPTHFTMTTGDEKEMLKASFYPELTDLGPVGSVMRNCDNCLAETFGGSMKDLCDTLPDENTSRSQCPVLTNGRVEYCQR